MFRYIKILIIVVGWLICTMVPYDDAAAVPCPGHLQDYQQPNGVTFKARLVGDEWSNHTEDQYGRIIVKSKDYWYYAVEGKGFGVVPSTRRVGIDRPQTNTLLVSQLGFFELKADSQRYPIHVLINQEPVVFQQPPILENGRVLVPLNDIFMAMGATVNWNEKTRTTTAIRGNVTVVCAGDSTHALINNETYPIDVPISTINKLNYGPLRFACEVFGGSAAWDQKTKMAIISIPMAGFQPPKGYHTDDITQRIILDSIKGFSPITCSFEFSDCQVNNLPMNNKVYLKGTGSITNAKQQISNVTLLFSKQQIEQKIPVYYCPFQELIVGPLQDAEAFVEGSELTWDTNSKNILILVNGVKTLESVQNLARLVLGPAFRPTSDQTLTSCRIIVDEESGSIVGIDNIVIQGNIEALITVKARLSGKITFKSS